MIGYGIKIRILNLANRGHAPRANCTGLVLECVFVISVIGTFAVLSVSIKRQFLSANHLLVGGGALSRTTFWTAFQGVFVTYSASLTQALRKRFPIAVELSRESCHMRR